MSQLLVQFSHLYKSFGPLPLFEDISLSINQGDLFAFIGENGAGKTTLLQLLAQSIPPDSGEFSKIQNLSISLLPQEVTFSDPSILAHEYLEDDVFSDLEKKMSSCLEDSKALDEWGELHEKYEQLGGYNRIPIEKVLLGLKLNGSLIDLPVSALSRGQIMRLALAKVLIENPDLLLLDEPTNHLDVEMLRWLEETLKKRRGACVIVSHDRKFLNAVCNQLVDVKECKITCYGGSYDFYLVEQDRILEKKLKEYEAQVEERSLLKQKIKEMTFSKRKTSPPSDRNIMAYDRRGEKHQKSVQHKLRLMKLRLSEIESNLLSHPKPKSIKGLRFLENPLSSPIAIELDQVGMSYGDKVLFSKFSKTICKNDRIVITGPNGCGKTTLLKAIAGLTILDSGSIKCSSKVRIAFLDQEVDLLPVNQTPIEYFSSRFCLTEENLLRELHKAGLGGSNLIKREFSILSTGQRKRLMLLSLVLEKPNILLLDEPTNHLDFITLQALESALLDFEGVIIAVSHDVTFIEKIANQQWRL